MEDSKTNLLDVAAEIKTGLKLYSVAGKTFLGNKDGKNIIGIEISGNPAAVSCLTRTDVSEYIAAMNEERLIRFTISRATELFTYEITPENEIVIDTVIATYKLALSRADQWLVNKVFSEYMGKR